MAKSDFLERVKKELTAKELSGLRAYHATTENGSIVFMPVIKRFGEEIKWTARVHLKGAMGPVPVSKASLKAIGAPADWAPKASQFLAALQDEYPALSPGLPEQEALPSGPK